MEENKLVKSLGYTLFLLILSWLGICAWTKVVCMCFELDWYTFGRGTGVWLVVMILRYIMMAAKSKT